MPISDASPTNDAPLGVFDSGLGGLTVVHALRQVVPHESIIYLGDTARVPYGTRSPATVERYARGCSRVLIDRGVKALIIACNTASAVAVDVLTEELDVPVLGVVEPGANAAVAVVEALGLARAPAAHAAHAAHPATATERLTVGVLGTVGTISSLLYFTFTTAKGATSLEKTGGRIQQVAAGFGKVFIMFTFGALFATGAISRIALLVDRMRFLIETLRPHILGL